MKSLCIKTNNLDIINYLQKSFENINLENTYISIKKFKHFNNIIIHHSGNDYTKFNNYISNSVTKAILKYCEEQIIYNNIILNYFYFSTYEKKKILENTLNQLKEDDVSNQCYDYINNEIFRNILFSHSLYLQGVINFKLTDYINFLNTQIDIAVNKFLIDKEYLEFVNILKLYIKSEAPNSQIDHVHLIYKDKISIITDDDQNIISYNDNLKRARYISDISFSSNDLALNTLLNLVPKTITIHLVDGYTDEFINTLKLIFQENVKICEECNICSVYKYKEKNKF